MDFLNALSIIILLRLDKHLNESVGRSVCDDFIKKVSQINVNEMFEYVNDDIETMSEQKKRYINLINIFLPEFRNIIGNIIDLNIMINIFPEIKRIMADRNIKITLKLAYDIENIQYMNFSEIPEILKQLSKIFIFDFNDDCFIDSEIIADTDLLNIFQVMMFSIY